MVLAELAPVRADADVIRAVAEAAGVQGGGDPTTTLAANLAPQPVLLVLDNCEHLLEASADLVDAALDAGTETRILVTSRSDDWERAAELLGAVGPTLRRGTASFIHHTVLLDRLVRPRLQLDAFAAALASGERAWPWTSSSTSRGSPDGPAATGRHRRGRPLQEILARSPRAATGPAPGPSSAPAASGSPGVLRSRSIALLHPAVRAGADGEVRSFRQVVGRQSVRGGAARIANRPPMIRFHAISRLDGDALDGIHLLRSPPFPAGHSLDGFTIYRRDARGDKDQHCVELDVSMLAEVRSRGVISTPDATVWADAEDPSDPTAAQESPLVNRDTPSTRSTLRANPARLAVGHDNLSTHWRCQCCPNTLRLGSLRRLGEAVIPQPARSSGFGVTGALVDGGSRGQRRPRVGLRRIGISLILAAGCVGIPAVPAHSDSLVFDDLEAVDLSDEAVVVRIANDGPQALSEAHATAFLWPSPATGSGQVAVPVALDFGKGFGVTASPPLAPGDVLLIRLSRPADVPVPASGTITVTAKDPSGDVIVGRRAIEIPEPEVTPGISKWSTVSTQALPWESAGDSQLGEPIPLQNASTCDAGFDATTYLVAGDDSAKVTATCDGNALQLASDAFPDVGTYAGTLKFGEDELSLEVRRTLGILWPALVILLGFALAVWSQNRAVGSQAQLRWWLRRMPRRASRADQQFVAKSTNADWDRYRLEPALRDEVTRLTAALNSLKPRLPRALWWLPWVESNKDGREKVLVQVRDLDSLIAGWPSFPDDIKHAVDRFAQSPLASIWAEELAKRLAEIMGPKTEPLPAKELIARRAFVQELADAIEIVEKIAELDTYLDRLEKSAKGEWSELDKAVLGRARQAEREASALLRVLSSPGEVVKQIGPLAIRGTTLAARLPVPERRRVADQLDTATAGQEAAQPIGMFLKEIVERLPGQGYVAGQSALVLTTLAVALWSGLALLYLGKPWGTPADFASAFVWGFGATIVLNPVLNLLRGFETGPSAPVKSS